MTLDWALFDPRVIQGDFPWSSTTAVCQTSNGRDVRVSLRLVDPPATSYVQLYTDDYVYGGAPSIVAADGNLLLIHMVVAVEGAPSCLFPDNFFVYKADPNWPWLRRLPSLGDWRGRARYTGVYHSQGDNFVVASLQVRALQLGADAHEVAELFRHSSAKLKDFSASPKDSSAKPEDCGWELLRFDMPYDAEKGLYPLCWETDKVLSYGPFMCWVDYHRGILYCDVSDNKGPLLRYIPLPGIEIWQDFKEGRGLPEMYRTISIREDKLYFVDVDDGRFQSSDSSHSITTWTLELPGLHWAKQDTLPLHDLWSHQKYLQSLLPRSTPLFPMVDMLEDGIVHFILIMSGESTGDWVATIDLRNLCCMSWKMYINDIEDPDSDADVKNMFGYTSLICSELCKCLNGSKDGTAVFRPRCMDLVHVGAMLLDLKDGLV